MAEWECDPFCRIFNVAGVYWEAVCLAGASMEGGNPEILLQSISRYYKFLPSAQRYRFLSEVVARRVS